MQMSDLRVHSHMQPRGDTLTKKGARQKNTFTCVKWQVINFMMQTQKRRGCRWREEEEEEGEEEKKNN